MTLTVAIVAACGAQSDPKTNGSTRDPNEGDPKAIEATEGESLLDAAVDVRVDVSAQKNDASAAPPLEEIPSFGSNPGNLSMFLHVPNPLPAHPVPVVVVLHGCLHTVDDYEKAVGFAPVADERGFFLLYPQTTANNGCFAWSDPSQARRDVGQALSIKQMIDHVKANFDVSDVYVTGASSGGAMTSVMLATYPDVFAAGAVMSGVPFACANTTATMMPCMLARPAYGADVWADEIRGAAPKPVHYPRVAVWHGAADTATSPINAAEIVSGWNEVHGLPQKPSATWTIGPATYSQFSDVNGNVKVEEWMIANMGHGVPLDTANGCGAGSKYMLDVGICSTRLAVDFFFGTPGGNLNVGPGSPWTCKEYFANNVDHGLAGRATLCPPTSLYACAVGSGEDLGLAAVTETSWLKETFLGYFTPGRCP